MIKNLVRHGDSWALVIDESLLALLNIDPDTLLEISKDGNSLVITPVNQDPRKAKVREASTKINDQYRETFKRLAE